ncbi:sigma-70 family RNA polymerase sigma factor [Acinetobacter sp. C26M]|uniref:sigma-70 family RNA polymerase sigma factor n=1 Tax=unclassified Acinetobacter TaxID=196816 RepID=UPI00141E6D42|nr:MULTISPECIES: sigma-70 family RNA polymerase sigma factor [unclassified Acinetobacter]USA48206.1 sigma-70 family RNA polymerase sigma factor [Acinetobacter sp. C26M]USA51686.1 sigma-70 family RNA polymerase sigma factor [Acinetobacter sp. C26G]
MNKTPMLVDQLYRNHRGWLHQWLRQKIGNTEQAADLVQDTFIKLLQTRDELLGIKEPRAYLTSIAKNLLIDQVRRKRIEQAYLDGLSQMEYMLDAIASPEDQMQIIQALDQLCKALEDVSAKAQQAFILHYLEGYTHKETAEQLGVSTKMIQKYLASCLTRCYMNRFEMDIHL